jgi:hypothetical protein
MKLTDEETTSQKEKDITELRERVDKLLTKDKQERDQHQTLAEYEAQKYRHQRIELEQQILGKLHQQDKRAEYLRQLEMNLKNSIDGQVKQRDLERQKLQEDNEERRKIAEYEAKMAQQDEELNNLEHNAARRLYDVISMKQKDEYEKKMNANYEVGFVNNPQNDDLLKEYKSLKAQQMPQSSQNSQHNRQIQNEVDERMMQLEETMTKIQIDKENRLRQIEYDYMQSTEQIKTEVKKK